MTQPTRALKGLADFQAFPNLRRRDQANGDAHQRHRQRRDHPHPRLRIRLLTRPLGGGLL